MADESKKNYIMDFLDRYGPGLKNTALAAGGGYARGKSLGIIDPSRKASLMESGPINEVGLQMRNIPMAANIGEGLSYLDLEGLGAQLPAKIGEKLGIKELGNVGKYLNSPTGYISKGVTSLGNLGEAGIGKIAKLMGADPSKGLPALTKSVVNNNLTRSAASGGIMSGVQGAARAAEGYQDPSQIPADIKSGAKIGLGVGALLSPVLGFGAKAAYSHPDILNKAMSGKEKEVDPYIQRLMNQGEWGNRESFRGVANKAKENFGNVVDPITQPMQNMLINPEKPYEGLADYANQLRKNMAFPAAENAQRGATEGTAGIYKNPKFGQAMQDLQGTTQLPWFDPELSAAANAKKQSLKDFRDATVLQKYGEATAQPGEQLGNKAWEERGQEAYDKIQQANKDYGFGLNLGENLNASAPFGGATPTTAYQATRKAINSTVGSLPIRTGTGLILKSAADRAGALGGVAAEKMNEGNPEAPKKDAFSDLGPVKGTQAIKKSAATNAFDDIGPSK